MTRASALVIVDFRAVSGAGGVRWGAMSTSEPPRSPNSPERSGELPTGSQSPGEDPSVVDPDALVEAREEHDQIAAFNSVSRLEELTAEARIQRGGRS
jgi:hypothetical protein